MVIVLLIRTFAALGDSYTEGLDDPYEDGGFRGWADRVAERLARDDPEFRYANLAIRGRLLREIIAEQVPVALRLKPDLVSLAGGGNDLLRGADPARLGALLREAVGKLRENGSQVLLFEGAEASRLPGGRRLTPRIQALNVHVRRAAAEFETLIAAPRGSDTFADRRLWGPDRLHLSSEGHQLVADGVLALLGVPPVEPADPQAPAGAAAPVDPAAVMPGAAALTVHPGLPLSWAALRLDDLRWARDYGLPWVSRRLRGRSSGDGRTPKRPELTPFHLEGTNGPPG
jgi:lysophospholipase L1-like esterase